VTPKFLRRTANALVERIQEIKRSVSSIGIINSLRTQIPLENMDWLRII
jgi:hypothetical protein